jgi:hypothetical protein
MATHPNAALDAHLQRSVGASGFSVSGATATIGAINMTAAQLRELVDASLTQKFDVKVVAGAVTIVPR